MKRTHSFKTLILVAVLSLVLAACAPADLDITPTPTPTVAPTATPPPTPTPVLPSPTPNAEESAAIAAAGLSPEDTVNLMVASVPDTISGGAIQWQQDMEEGVSNVRGTSNGFGRKIALTERGGGSASLTFAVFDTPEDAQAHFDRLAEIRNNTAQGRPNEVFPGPNAFGSGTYGSYGLVLQENVYVEVSVEVFSSTSGNPVPALMRSALEISETGIALAAEGPQDMDPVLAAVLGAMPATVSGGNFDWEQGDTTPVLVDNGEAVEVQYTAGTSSMTVFVGHFEIPSAAILTYEDIYSRGTAGSILGTTVILINGDEPQITALTEILTAVESGLAES
jgi:hypothetical protein